MGKFGQKFGGLTENSPVVQVTDQILSKNNQANEHPEGEAKVSPMQKKENGMTINVPMDDYVKMTMIKLRTGKTLKELALQAVHEFVERNG